MDNEAYNAICNILNHELREQDHAVLAERIRIATAVLPAIYARWCDTPDVVKMDDGSQIRRYSFAKIALDIADELLVEAVARTNKNAQRR